MSHANFLVIMADEHQGREMGCAGHDFVKTPNLDLANEPKHADTLASPEAELRAILVPKAVDDIAFSDHAD